MKNIVVLASGNVHKIKEFREIMTDYEIISLKDIGFSGDIDENGKTLFENSLIKAIAISKFLKEKNLNYSVIADDSGLFCEGLNGLPGINSARFSGSHGDDEANRKKLLQELDKVENRKAYFGCVVVMVNPNGTYYVGDGKTYGTILKEYAGDTSFGYDCIFQSDDLNTSFGLASSVDKNSVSHRKRAIIDLLKNIEEGRSNRI